MIQDIVFLQFTKSEIIDISLSAFFMENLTALGYQSWTLQDQYSETIIDPTASKLNIAIYIKQLWKTWNYKQIIIYFTQNWFEYISTILTENIPMKWSITNQAQASSISWNISTNLAASFCT